ncbi:MAG: ATP-binding protein [Pseudomonadota bacterium]
MPEFDRHVLEVLRQPLESGRITIARAASHADFPARFQLIAAMNPCPCGYLGHSSGKCHCTQEAITRYQDRVSGPLLDRLDILVDVNPLEPEVLEADADGEPSATIAARVAAAWQRQIERQGKTNQLLGTRELERHCRLDAEGERTLRASMLKMHWSARAYHRVVRLARTIADLEGRKQISARHVSRAIQLRRALRQR